MESNIELSEKEACDGASILYVSHDESINLPKVDQVPPGMLPYRSEEDYTERIDQEPREVYIIQTNNGYRAVRIQVTRDLSTNLGEKVFVLRGRINDAEFIPKLRLLQRITSKISHNEIVCCFEKLKDVCYYFFKFSAKKSERRRTRSSIKKENDDQ